MKTTFDRGIRLESDAAHHVAIRRPLRENITCRLTLRANPVVRGDVGRLHLGEQTASAVADDEATLGIAYCFFKAAT